MIAISNARLDMPGSQVDFTKPPLEALKYLVVGNFAWGCKLIVVTPSHIQIQTPVFMAQQDLIDFRGSDADMELLLKACGAYAQLTRNEQPLPAGITSQLADQHNAMWETLLRMAASTPIAKRVYLALFGATPHTQQLLRLKSDDLADVFSMTYEGTPLEEALEMALC